MSITPSNYKSEAIDTWESVDTGESNDNQDNASDDVIDKETFMDAMKAKFPTISDAQLNNLWAASSDSDRDGQDTMTFGEMKRAFGDLVKLLRKEPDVSAAVSKQVEVNKGSANKEPAVDMEKHSSSGPSAIQVPPVGEPISKLQWVHWASNGGITNSAGKPITQEKATELWLLHTKPGQAAHKSGENMVLEHDVLSAKGRNALYDATDGPDGVPPQPATPAAIPAPIPAPEQSIQTKTKPPANSKDYELDDYNPLQGGPDSSKAVSKETAKIYYVENYKVPEAEFEKAWKENVTQKADGTANWATPQERAEIYASLAGQLQDTKGESQPKTTPAMTPIVDEQAVATESVKPTPEVAPPVKPQAAYNLLGEPVKPGSPNAIHYDSMQIKAPYGGDGQPQSIAILKNGTPGDRYLIKPEKGVSPISVTREQDGFFRDNKGEAYMYSSHEGGLIKMEPGKLYLNDGNGQELPADAPVELLSNGGITFVNSNGTIFDTSYSQGYNKMNIDAIGTVQAGDRADHGNGLYMTRRDDGGYLVHNKNLPENEPIKLEDFGA